MKVRNINDDIVNKIAQRNNIDVAIVKNIINTTYTEAELRNMNLLTQLRVLGRIKGVKSPTNRSADDIINAILSIQNGNLCPEYTFKGRKVKNTVPLILGQLYQNNSDQTDEDDVNFTGVMSGSRYGGTDHYDEMPMDIADDTIDPDADTDDKTDQNGDFKISGVLQLLPEGFGFLRTSNYHISKKDVFVSVQQIKRFNLRQGDKIECTARCFDKTKAPSLIFIHTINDQPCDKVGRRPHFAEFSATYPTERILLSQGADENDYSLRAIDLIAPIGKGQRGLIVAPPKTGKTILIKKIAKSISKTYGDKIKLFVLLVSERPEEVTDMRESLPEAEVVFSTFDQTPFHHASVAEMVLNNSKHRVEQGQDVVILMDSLTRLAHAYNKTAEAGGRTLSGGLDVSALEVPKAFFGSARKVVGGGSLTILATALIDTGSRMDEVIYEEFKGTGNMEIHLDRELADRRIFPSIDLKKSGTRHEEKLLTQKELDAMWTIRRKLADTQNKDACMQLLDMLTTTKNNDEFIALLNLANKKNK